MPEDPKPLFEKKPAELEAKRKLEAVKRGGPASTEPAPKVDTLPPEKQAALAKVNKDNQTSWVMYAQNIGIAWICLLVGFFVNGLLLNGVGGGMLIFALLFCGVLWGGFISFLWSKYRWAWLQRRSGKNVGMAVVLNRGLSGTPYIIDLDKDTAEIKGFVYKLYSVTVRPVLVNGVPTLYFRQGVAEPLHWDVVISQSEEGENDAGLSARTFVKIKALYQSIALATFGEGLKKLLIVVLLGEFLIVLCLLYILFVYLPGLNAGQEQIYNIVNSNHELLQALNTTAAHAGVIAGGIK